MAYNTSAYNSLSEGDIKKTYRYLKDIIRRYIERKGAGGAPETEGATPVKPRPNPKKHPEDKNKKGKKKRTGEGMETLREKLQR